MFSLKRTGKQLRRQLFYILLLFGSVEILKQIYIKCKMCNCFQIKPSMWFSWKKGVAYEIKRKKYIN